MPDGIISEIIHFAFPLLFGGSIIAYTKTNVNKKSVKRSILAYKNTASKALGSLCRGGYYPPAFCYYAKREADRLPYDFGGSKPPPYDVIPLYHKSAEKQYLYRNLFVGVTAKSKKNRSLVGLLFFYHHSNFVRFPSSRKPSKESRLKIS